MWWEILPSAAIITTCFLIPPFAFKGLNWIFLGKPVSRWLVESDFNVDMFKRDERLTGWAFTVNGLEAVPDLEEIPEEPKHHSFFKPQSFPLGKFKKAFSGKEKKKEEEKEEDPMEEAQEEPDEDTKK